MARVTRGDDLDFPVDTNDIQQLAKFVEQPGLLNLAFQEIKNRQLGGLM